MNLIVWRKIKHADLRCLASFCVSFYCDLMHHQFYLSYIHYNLYNLNLFNKIIFHYYYIWIFIMQFSITIFSWLNINFNASIFITKLKKITHEFSHEHFCFFRRTIPIQKIVLKPQLKHRTTSHIVTLLI